MVAMLVLLASLLIIYLRLGLARTVVRGLEWWAVHIPFSIYLGWVSVATIANATIVLEWANWGRWGMADEVWAIIMLIVAAIVGILVALTRRDVAFPLVIVWALVGIAVRQPDVAIVATPAIVLAVLVGLVALGVIILRQRDRRLVRT
jgi:hypothetical protein